jgi:type VI secretion system protein ImpG
VTVQLPLNAIRFPGLDPQRSVLPEPPRAFSAFALLHDYFAFPERYLFVDIAGLDRGHDIGAGAEFDLVIRLTDWPDGLRRVEPSNFRLGCVPVVNVFESDARPIRIARERSEYPLVADADGANEMETYGVLGISGIAEGGEDRAFAPLYSLEHRPPRTGDARVYYQTHVRPSLRPPRTETWFSLIDTGSAASIPPVETIAARLLCTNGDVPTTLGPGDVRERAFSTPDGVQFRDITRMMPPVPPPLDGKTSWKLVSLIATSYLSIADRDNLRTLLRLMDFRSAHDKSAEQKLQLKLEAIESVAIDADDWLVRGRVVRGRAVTIAIRDRKFGGTGEVHLFGSVLDVVLSMFSSINSHTRLTIVGKDSGEEMRWKPRHGSQILQ